MSDGSEGLGLRNVVSASQDMSAERKPILHFWRCFWLAFLVISIAYAAYCYYVPPNRIAWAEGYDNARANAIATDKPMILFFTAKWCVPCRIMKRQVWADPEVMEQVNRHFIPVMVEVGDSKSSDLMQRYDVKGAPVTIITSPDGRALTWQAGGMGKDEFVGFLDESNWINTENS